MDLPIPTNLGYLLEPAGEVDAPSGLHACRQIIKSDEEAGH